MKPLVREELKLLRGAVGIEDDLFSCGLRRAHYRFIIDRPPISADLAAASDRLASISRSDKQIFTTLDVKEISMAVYFSGIRASTRV